jgi:hypothetical protein
MSKSVRIAIAFTVAIAAVGLIAFASMRGDAAVAPDAQNVASIDPMAITLASGNLPDLGYDFEAI